MKIWNVVLAALIWWSATFGPSLVCSYQTVEFTTKAATSITYQKFIKDVRGALVTEQTWYGIPLLRQESALSVLQRFILVSLTHETDEGVEYAVTFALDVTTANMVAYNAGYESFFFSDAPVDADYLFVGTIRNRIGHGGRYEDLEMAAHTRREHIKLGMTALTHAIDNLSHLRHNSEIRARALIVCIQMTSEAARFRYIERRILTSITNNRDLQPDALMLELENNWLALSSAVQISNGGVLYPPIQLKIPNRNPIIWDYVTPEVTIHLAFIMVACVRAGTGFNPLVRTVVSNEYEFCTVSEPAVRIIGANGLCADVARSEYSNGNPIILYRCKSDDSANQLWTLKADGTIRSNGWCMTTHQNQSPGDKVTVFKCEEAPVHATRWQIWDFGDIYHPASELVLTSNSLDSGTKLTVEEQIYFLGQGWRPTNISEPIVRSIVGFMDLCLEANGTRLLMKECARNKTEQQWALYQDGSIRPQQRKDYCVTCNDRISREIVYLSLCHPKSSGQRWMFNSDGTIMSWIIDLVLEVKASASDPSLQEVITWFVSGEPNQQWFPVPL